MYNSGGLGFGMYQSKLVVVPVIYRRDSARLVISQSFTAFNNIPNVVLKQSTVNQKFSL